VSGMIVILCTRHLRVNNRLIICGSKWEKVVLGIIL
jgi:hypothetical protein